MKRRTVLITGGASGVGLETTRQYAAMGWNVLCHYHLSPNAATLHDEIKSHGGECQLIQGNLADPEQVQGIIEFLHDLPVDALVNNAGSYVISKKFCDLNLADLREVFQLNVFAPTLLSTFLFKKMCQNSFGRIVNISSIAAKYGGSANSLHYGQTKRALEGLTLTLGKLGASHNVLVNTVRPGIVDTAFHKKFPKDMTERVKMVPAGRMATAAEIAKIVVFLGSQDNTYITRDCITIAGGE